MDLEIFAFPLDFENLSPRVDLEIFTNVIRASINDDLKLRAMQSLESVFVRKSQCITEEDLDQLRCRPTSFSTNYESSTLNFDLNRGPVFWSHRRTSQVVIVVRARSKEEAMCRRGPHKLWLKRATIRLLNTTGRVSRCLKPTVWTVEQSVSGVLYISSLLRSPKLPKRKGISLVGPKVQQPPRGGTWVDDTCRYIKILWDISIIEQMAVCFNEFSKIFSMQFQLNIHELRAFYTVHYSNFFRVGPMSWARGCGLLCGFPPFSIEKSSSIFVLWFWSNANTGRIGRTPTPLSAGRDVVFPGANKSPTDMDYPVGPKVQQPPSGGTWVGSTCNILTLYLNYIKNDRWTYHRGIFTRKKGMSPCFRTRMIGKTLTHDRSCLEMFEADGVDSGAICKRGFIHLQFAEKPEAPEAERHLGSRILEHDRSCLEMFEADGVDSGAICKRGFIHLQFAEKPEAPEAERHLVSVGWVPWNGPLGVGFCAGLLPSVPNNRAGFLYSGFARPVGLQLQQPPLGGTWVGSTCESSKSYVSIGWDSWEGLMERRLFYHASHANFRVESPLARGSLDAATSTRWDLGRLGDRGTDHLGIFTWKEL
ncbi:hypothetical protein V1477_014681 [Vespula maculifrons]|uniref:Uncharacterized protein n=1 Tax=Vespula maculifrons TaxID=7453 RepID=A0ABD2BI49_VESMC